ncbi:MAG TPA: hypothetical protein VH138_06385 [Vicinamibacterales bacterium]|jgi:hypothetical protein|nr:hypothetical protein [Vicinamibacterales bacterium]
MQKQTIRGTSVCTLVFALGACSGSATKTSTPTTPTAPAIVISAPVPVSPDNGGNVTGWPTLTVNNATRTGPAGVLTYRFDVSTASDFTNITVTGSIVEGAGQTSFTPNVPVPADQSTLYWRAIAIDAINAVQSPASATQSFKENNPLSKAAQIAAQQGRTLWPGAVPSGTPGQTTMGKGWDVGQLVSFDGASFLSPELDQLQWFDCVDRGMAPQAALDWMRSHGYSTQAVFYPDTGSGIPVVGYPHQYIAFEGGRWDMVLRSGA